MIESIFNYLSELLYGNFYLAVFSAFVWGLLSIVLSPCHLSSIPLVIGFLSNEGAITLKRTFSLSLVFAVGILITIAIIGAITLSLGRLMGDIGDYGNYLVVIIFFIVGLYLMDIIKIPWLGRGLRPTKFKGMPAAFVLGLLFGIGLGPCTFAFMAPVLSIVFEVSSRDVFFAVMLLLAFSLGHCFVIVLAGTATRVIQKYLNWSEKNKTQKYFKRVCGVLVILAGVYLLFNK